LRWIGCQIDGVDVENVFIWLFAELASDELDS
jgi:hypothetical protein